jgi:hypothetical protein
MEVTVQDPARARAVAMLVRAPARPGARQIWADLQGKMAEDFDEPPEEFAPYT